MRVPVLGLVVLAVVACSRPQGVHRDQFVFAGRDGTVLALGLVRDTAGTAEAKGWLGVQGAWGTPVYDRFPIVPRRASDLEGSVRAWSTARTKSVRASFTEDDGGAHLRLRTRQARLVLDAERATSLGASRDPEGPHEYSVRRAHLRTGGTDRDGWLVREHTPDAHPLRPLVDYGNFVLVFAARADGDVAVAKRSLRRRGYDFAVVRRGGVVKRSRSVRVSPSAQGALESLALLAGGDAINLPVADRSVSTGIDPHHRPVRYEVLLLGGGGDWAGVAFTIRPAVTARD